MADLYANLNLGSNEIWSAQGWNETLNDVNIKLANINEGWFFFFSRSKTPQAFLINHLSSSYKTSPKK